MSITWNEAPESAHRAMKSQSGLLFFCSVEKYLHAGEESKDGSPVMFGGRSCFTIGEFKLVEMRPINSGINVENKDHLAYREVKPCESGSETDSIDSTLKERGSRYGEYKDNARVAQEIKRAMKSGTNSDDLRDIQREALEVIAAKIARIVNGDPDYIDNWHDIAGYARLVEIELEGQKAPN